MPLLSKALLSVFRNASAENCFEAIAGLTRISLRAFSLLLAVVVGFLFGFSFIGTVGVGVFSGALAKAWAYEGACFGLAWSRALALASIFLVACSRLET